MIQFRDVTKVYRKTGTALEAIDLSFDEGEFAFITGPSGAGKTTLLKLLYAAEHPTSGEVLIEGRSVSRLHPRSVPWLRRNMGVVVQDFRLLPRRTVAENVALALEVCGLKQSEIQRRVHETLERVGLEGMSERLPTELSGGEQQRTAIARAVVNEPSIVLADEPTGNLDHELSSDIMGLLVGLCREKGATILVATHDRKQLEAWNVREVQLTRGRLAHDLPPRADVEVATGRIRADHGDESATKNSPDNPTNAEEGAETSDTEAPVLPDDSSDPNDAPADSTVPSEDVEDDSSTPPSQNSEAAL